MKKPTVVANGKPIFDFLDSYDARLLSIYTSKSPTVAARELRTYLVNCQVIVVSLGEHGWDIYMPVSKSNEVAKTIADAEQALGPRPGDGHLATLEQCNV